jgi:WD40 repeat protein
LKQEVERLRRELEKTRLELLQSRLENAQLKAQAEVTAAQAQLAAAQAEAALRKARAEAIKGQQNTLGSSSTNPFGTGTSGSGTPNSTPSPEKPVAPTADPTADKIAAGLARLAYAQAIEAARRAEDEASKLQNQQTPPQKPAAGLPPIPSAISPDGRSVATANDMTIIMLDLRTGKVLFKAQAARPTSLAFSPDGKLLASAEDKAIIFWDSATGKQVRGLNVPNPVTSLRFSGDARLIIIVEGDRTQREFDAATGKELRVIRPDQEKRP